MSKELNELTKTRATSRSVSEVDYSSKGTRERRSSRHSREKTTELSGSQLRRETEREEHTDSSCKSGRKKSGRKRSHERDSSVFTTQSSDGVHDSTATKSKKKKRKEPKTSAATANTAPSAVQDGQPVKHEPSSTTAGRITVKEESRPGHSTHVTPQREATNGGGGETLVLKSPEAAKKRPMGTSSKNLTRINLALGLIAAGVLLVIVVLVRARAQTYAVCNTTGCAQFSKIFKASLNHSAANPCDNFTAFVCNGWTRHNKFSVRQNLVVEALRTLSVLSRVVQTEAKIETPAEGAKAFFRSCDAVLRGESDQLPMVKRFLTEANVTWPWRPTTPDVLQTMLYASVKLRWSPLFNIEIDATVDYGTDVFLMPFDDFRLLRRKFDSLERGAEGDMRAYFNFLRDKFGSPETEEGQITYEDVADVSNCMLAPLFESLKEQSTPEAVSTSLLLQQRANLTISRWESALAVYGVTQTPVVYSTNALPYIVKFFELWDVYGESKTHLLISWCTVQIAALYANRELIFNYYGSEERALVEHGAFCLSKAYLIGKFSLFTNYTSHVLERNGHEDVEKIARNVRHAFHSRLQGWKHYEPIRAVVADWDSMATVFSALDASGAYFANKTQIRPTMGESLPENWRKAAISLKTMHSDKVFLAMLSSGVHVVLYNDFILLPFSAAFPLYLVNVTDAVKYGGIGKEMALSLSGLFYDTYRLFPQANYSIVNVSMCMGGPQALASNLEAVAINALYDAYMDAYTGSDIRLVDLEEYTASQIFFIASCYSKCPGSVDTNNGDCNAALRHVEPFTIAFRCPRRSFMSPDKPCHLF